MVCRMVCGWFVMSVACLLMLLVLISVCFGFVFACLCCCICDYRDVTLVGFCMFSCSVIMSIHASFLLKCCFVLRCVSKVCLLMM